MPSFKLYQHSLTHEGKPITFTSSTETLMRTPEGCVMVGKSRNVKLYRDIMTQLGHDLDGLEVHHTCFNPACVNPAHLEVMTHAEHVAAHLAAGRPFARGRKRGQPLKAHDNRSVRKSLLAMSYANVCSTVGFHYRDYREVSIAVVIDMLIHLDFINSEKVFEFHRGSLGMRRCQKIAAAARRASGCIKAVTVYDPMGTENYAFNPFGN